MTAEEIIQNLTAEQFAILIFERDRTNGLYTPWTQWANLDGEEKQLYLEEGAYYINEHPRDDWPVDVIEAIKLAAELGSF